MYQSTYELEKLAKMREEEVDKRLKHKRLLKMIAAQRRGDKCSRERYVPRNEARTCSRCA